MKWSLTANETLVAKLEESWGSQSSELEERRKSRAEDILAIHETIELLNDDDVVELFKATQPSHSSVEDDQSIVAAAGRAMGEVRWSSRAHSDFASNLKLISLALSGKSVDSSKVISMIDEMVVLLEAEQGEDDGTKACGIKSSGQTEEEARFRLVKSLAAGMRPLTPRISCPALRFRRCRRNEFRSTSLERPLMSLFCK